jgi:predicted membrane-bound spermidine synthase
MKRKIFKNKKLLLLALFIISAIVTQGALAGLDIVDTMEKVLEFTQTIGYFVLAIGIVTFILNMFLGSRSMPVAVIGVGGIIAGWAMANVETAVTWFTNFSAGACF